MSRESIAKAIKLIKEAAEAKELTDLVVKEVEPYIDRMVDYMVDKQVQAVERFQANGFTREEALQMTMSMKANALDQLTKLNNK